MGRRLGYRAPRGGAPRSDRHPEGVRGSRIDLPPHRDRGVRAGARGHAGATVPVSRAQARAAQPARGAALAADRLRRRSRGRGGGADHLHLQRPGQDLGQGGAPRPAGQRDRGQVELALRLPGPEHQPDRRRHRPDLAGGADRHRHPLQPDLAGCHPLVLDPVRALQARRVPAPVDIVRALVPRRRVPHRRPLRRVLRPQARADGVQRRGHVPGRLQPLGHPETRRAVLVSTATTTVPRARGGVLGLIASTDHKSVGMRIFLTGFFFFIAGGILALLIRAELYSPGQQLVNQDHFNEIFSMHGSTMIYLFVVPISLALGVYFVPLQVGAAEIALPRVALLGWWLLIGGGVTMWLGWFTQNGPGDAGWTAFDPLSDSTNSPGDGMYLWIIGVMLAAASALLLSAAILGTVMRRRAPGMTMLRLPVFTWSMLMTAVLMIVAAPSLLVAIRLLYWESVYCKVYDSSGGPVGYQNLFL